MQAAEEPLPESIEVLIALRGGPAEVGEVPLEDYRVSLAGWQSVIELSARLFFLGKHAEPTRRGASPFSLHVRAPERGSVTTQVFLELQKPEIWAVGLTIGVLGNALYDVLKAQTIPFVKWMISLCRSHTDTKRRISNIDLLAENLRRLIEAEDLPGNQLARHIGDVPVTEQPLLHVAEPEVADADAAESPLPAERQKSWLRQIAESVDVSLEEATRPIRGGCTSVELQEVQPRGDTEKLVLDAADYAALLAPLSYVEPDAEWKAAHIQFRRIDRDSSYFQKLWTAATG